MKVKDAIVSSYNDALTPIFLYMVPLVIVGLILLVFVVEILPESLEIDGGSWDLIDADTAADTDRPTLGTTSR